MPVGEIDVTVRNGVVQFIGTITHEKQRQALRVAAENISGVKKVEDDLTYPEPVSGWG
jgi:osmotically-inducible protein OsmY